MMLILLRFLTFSISNQNCCKRETSDLLAKRRVKKLVVKLMMTKRVTRGVEKHSQETQATSLHDVSSQCLQATRATSFSNPIWHPDLCYATPGCWWAVTACLAPEQGQRGWKGAKQKGPGGDSPQQLNMGQECAQGVKKANSIMEMKFSVVLGISCIKISGNMATEHVNGNGTEEPMDTSAAVTHSEHFQTLLDAGLPQKVAEKLDEIYVAGLVAHSDLDERAIEALKEFNEEGALAVLQQFKDSDLSHVQNKSAFLCGVMKTYRQREKQGTKVADSSKGPDEAKIKALLERTGYTLDVTTGQRKYGGPPPESIYSGQQPSVGTEIFVGKIPRDLFEDELVPLFEKAGPIWDLRLMMDPLTGLNRGYAFVTFCTKEAAQEAVKLYNNHEIRSGKHIGVCISVANNRLFVGSIPKSKTKEQIVEEFSKVTEGLTDVILYHQPDDKKKNRGFCFLEYEDHKTAAQARRRLMSGKVKVWGNVVTVEWADPIEDPDPEVMAKVKVLFVRNLANTVTEEILEKAFSQFGKLERVKKLKDYAFIHFDERDGAVKAMEEMNGKDLEGENIEIVFAKPPDQKRKERKAQRQAAKNQMYDDYYYYGPPHMPPPTRGRGRGGRGGYGYPPDYYGYEDYYDYYGYDYHNYRGGYEDPYYGYEDFQVGARGRGGRGARGAAPSRGRGAAPPRGRAGYAQRGGPGSARGVRGARGGAQQQRGRGVRGARGGRGGNVGGKRKADGYNQPDSKRRQTNNQNWGSQPIAQQPLQGGDHSGNYGYKSENQEFYQDSFGQQWK
ncbi:Heterogeneous nuclear ribonucleoprotein Q [Willisornis vidua]|nr:Heterogeneous nuclear ribonucleoprotein Q [Willisornis vidua]